MKNSKHSIGKTLSYIGGGFVLLIIGFLIVIQVILEILVPVPQMCELNILNSTSSSSFISESLELIGHFGGSVESVFTNNSYAYVGIGSEIAILDITNPSQPQRVGYVVLPDKAVDIHVDGNYAYVATGESGLRIVDISSPTNPIEVGFYTTSVKINKVTVSNGYVYLPLSACNSGGTFLPTRCRGAIQIIDATDPSNPTRIACHKMFGTPASISIDEDYAYISEFVSSGISEARLLKMNISNPRFARIIKIHNVDFGGKTIINNSYIYVSARYDKFRIIDISNPNIFVETGLYDSRNPSGTRNAIFAAVVDEKYAYLIVEDVGVQVIDISDTHQPILLSSYVIDDEIKDISLIESHVYIATENNGLQVIDMTNPSIPALIGVYESPKSVTKLEVINNLIYAAAEDNGFRIIDASNPEMPFQIGHYELPEEVTQLADEYDPVYITGVAIEGNQAYLAVKDLGVQVAEISDPSSITGTAFYPLENGINDIAIHNNFFYISTEHNGIETSNSLSDLSNKFGWYNMPYSFVDVAAGDRYAYLLSQNGLLTLDISDPKIFNQVDFYELTSNNSLLIDNNYIYIASSYGLRVIGLSESGIPNKDQYSVLAGINLEDIVLEGNYIYAATSKGLWIVDISNPLQPSIIGSYKTENWTYHLTKIGNYVYLNVDNEGIRIIDVSNPSTPFEVNTYKPLSGYASNITTISPYAYVASGNGGLRILDVTNPAIPTEIGFIENIGFARDIEIKNNFAYIALREGLAIVDITNPSQPSLIKNYKLPRTSWREKITLVGDYVYLPAHDDGLWIIDIATLSQTEKIYHYENVYEIKGIDIQADYAYIASDNDGLRIINITETRTASEVGIYGESGVHIEDVSVFENIAYVANLNYYTFEDTKNDLLVIDILNRSNPVKINSYELPWNAWGIEVNENYIYVGAGTDGIFIYRIKE